MVALIAVLLTVPGIVGTTSVVQDASTDISEIETKIYNTGIAVSSLSSSADSALVTFTVSNPGSEKLWDFANFDLFITYNGTSSGLRTEQLTYSGTCSGDPSAGNWCINSFTNDLLDPSILNQGEAMNLRSTLSENADTGLVAVIISTNNGVSTSKSTTN